MSACHRANPRPCRAPGALAHLPHAPDPRTARPSITRVNVAITAPPRRPNSPGHREIRALVAQPGGTDDHLLDHGARRAGSPRAAWRWRHPRAASSWRGRCVRRQRSVVQDGCVDFGRHDDRGPDALVTTDVVDVGHQVVGGGLGGAVGRPADQAGSEARPPTIRSRWCPRRAATMSGSTAWVRAKTPMRLTPTTAST